MIKGEMAVLTTSKPFKLFISHAHEDSKVARELSLALKAEGFRTWEDNDILPGDSWASAIDQQLRESDAMIVHLSPAWAASPAIRTEVTYALGAPRFDGRLIPVILKKTKDYPWVLDLNNFQMITYKSSALTGREIAQALRDGDRKGPSKGPAAAQHGQEKLRSR